MCAELVHEAVHAAHQPVALVDTLKSVMNSACTKRTPVLRGHLASPRPYVSPPWAEVERAMCIRAMGSYACYVVSCRARDREQPR